MADFRDSLTFHKPITAAAASGNRIPQFVEIPFVAADIVAGSVAYDDLPANVLILGARIVITTPLTFSNVGTTGVSAKIGNAAEDDAGFGTATAIAGAAGYRRFPPGALVGGTVPGGTDGVLASFTATGGAADLAHVSAGAGKVVVDFIEV
jgi:hypothetical protein